MTQCRLEILRVLVSNCQHRSRPTKICVIRVIRVESNLAMSNLVQIILSVIPKANNLVKPPLPLHTAPTIDELIKNTSPCVA